MADQAEIARHSHPLSRIVICCTSVPPDARQILAKKAQDMGARHVLNLTSDVTHLVCEDITTPKYKYVAKMRTDVKVMMSGWVDAMYGPWIEGEDINPRDFEEKYKLPILYKLSISITGILDMADRKKIEELVVSQAATYHPDLTRHVSHLIAAAPIGKKYEFAKDNDISVVTVEWLHDSLERGMALEESCYDPCLPREKLGAGARPAAPSIAPMEVIADVRGKRKIRKRAEDLLGSQSQGLWGDILGQASNPKPKKRDEWDEDSRAGNAMKAEKLTKNTLHQANRVDARTGMLAPCTFYIYGYTKKQAETVHNILISHGANVVSSFQALEKFRDLSRLFVVVPVSMRKRDCPDVSNIGHILIVTEWWIEACMHKSRLVEPSEGFTFSPYDDYPLEGFKGMEICLTQFTGIELLHLGKLITLLGGTFHEILSKKRNLLVTSLPAKGDKFDFAIQNDIPVVTPEWFKECLKESKAVPFTNFLVKGQKRPPRERPALPEDPESNKRTRGETGDPADSKRPRLSGVNFRGGKLLGENLQSFSNRLKREDPGGNTGTDADKKTSGPPPNDRDTHEHVVGGQGVQMSVQRDGGQEESKKSGVLDQCVVCVSRQLKARSVELNSVAKSLGASVIDSFTLDDIVPITHLVHSSKTTRDTAEDFQIASAIDGCHIVSPDWLYKCDESGKMVDEKAYPPPILPSANLEMDFAQDNSSGLSPISTMEPQMPLDSKVKVERRKPGVDKEKGDDEVILPHGNDDDDLDAIYQGGNLEPTPPTSVPVPTLPLALGTRKPFLSVQSASEGNQETSESWEMSERKTIGGIGDILGKLGKGELTSAMEKRKRPRGKLQGRATSNLSYNNFSRASSVDSSRTRSVPPSQQGCEVKKLKDMNTPSKQHEQELPAPSQAVRYADPEAEKERKSVRAKLSGDTIQVETPKPTRGTRRIKTAVDVEGSVMRRTKRNR